MYYLMYNNYGNLDNYIGLGKKITLNNITARNVHIQIAHRIEKQVFISSLFEFFVIL